MFARTHHNNAGGAETTLATVADRNPLLDGVGILHISDALDRNDMLAIDADQRGETCVDGGMVNLLGGLIEMRNHLTTENMGQ